MKPAQYSLFLLVFNLGSMAMGSESIPTGEGTLEIIPKVHSSVELNYKGLVIQVDPWGVIGFDNYSSADLILVTDNPSHHLDPLAIDSISTPDTRVVIPANSRQQMPGGIVMQNGETLQIKGVEIEAIAAYDIIQGAPEHPKGDANGYVLTLGNKRLYFAGVTECVDEVKSLEDINIAFMPMNIPLGRMTPEAAAACTKLLNPEMVFVYHYDQTWARRISSPEYMGPGLPGGRSIEESIQVFARELEGSAIKFKQSNWYPTLPEPALVSQ
ncbi:MAG: MBL fold metallo-hydrolase [Gammaproteobacteria bacterium]|nr:MBL fold metallo-hydrolase [Gammaproteobacteria bacterium]